MFNKLFPNGLPMHPLEAIKASKLPVLLYGMGDGAEKMMAVCNEYGIKVSGVFASDGFRSGKTFLAYNVLTVSDLPEIYPQGFVALVCFGCKACDMRMYIGKVRRAGGIVYMPHLPLFGGELFTYDTVEKHNDEIKKAYGLLCDEGSKNLFLDVLRYCLTWDPDYLFMGETNSYVFPSFFDDKVISSAIDGGAYRGDTVLSLCDAFPSIERMYAFEPDAANFAKLKNTTVPNVRIDFLPLGLHEKNGILSFAALKNRGSHFADGGIDVPVTSVDEAVGEKIDLIKLDVEGCEAAAIKGALKTIKSNKPCLYVSLYHKTNDLFELILLINEIDPSYRFSLLRADVCPAWDIILLAK
ncbi:MAG: FkbM family methyltransferase [Clostridia bacterium]|nr:FkbM family methyltransferase [Clostridia bacterium]